MPPSEWMAQAEEQHCGKQTPVTIHIHNDSKTRFDTFWLHPKLRKLQQVTSEPVEYRNTAPYHSYLDQIFELHEVPNEETGECVEMVCRRVTVQVKEEGDMNNVFRLTKAYTLEQVTDELEAKAYFGEVIESNLELINTGNTPIKLYYIPPGSGEPLLLSTIAVWEQKKYTSYATNMFQVEETGPCEKDDSCRINRFSNPPNNPSK
jgi:hypothetical protein